MQQYSYMNIDDKKSLQILYHSFETTGNMHNVHIYIYKKKKEISIDFHNFFKYQHYAIIQF